MLRSLNISNFPSGCFPWWTWIFIPSTSRVARRTLPQCLCSHTHELALSTWMSTHKWMEAIYMRLRLTKLMLIQCGGVCYHSWCKTWCLKSCICVLFPGHFQVLWWVVLVCFYRWKKKMKFWDVISTFSLEAQCTIWSTCNLITLKLQWIKHQLCLAGPR